MKRIRDLWWDWGVSAWGVERERWGRVLHIGRLGITYRSFPVPWETFGRLVTWVE